MAGPGCSTVPIRVREISDALKSSRSIKRNYGGTFEKDDACHERPRGGRCQCVSHRPPVPKHDDPAPIPYPPSQSNYVSYNAKHVADVANYHDIKPQMVDSKDGHVMNLEKSGLVPQFVKKPTYGRVPPYLRKNPPTSQPEEVAETPPTKAAEPIKDKPITHRSANKEIEVLQQRWIELEKRLGLVSFSRPDKRELLEDELRNIELRLRMAANS